MVIRNYVRQEMHPEYLEGRPGRPRCFAVLRAGFSRVKLLLDLRIASDNTLAEEVILKQ